MTHRRRFAALHPAPALALALALVQVLAGDVRADRDADTQALEFHSGTRQLILVELYTSEGCSSCPPADRWLSGFVGDKRLWREVVPVGFHVDYWDWIGWRDRFADAAWSERQRRHVREGNADVVYTPGFFANGREWRGFFGDQVLDPPRPEAGPLSLRVSNREVSARFAPAGTAERKLTLHVAVLGMGLTSSVASGENRGRRLRHDFVVLGLSRRMMTRDAAAFGAELRLPPASRDAAAIAAWVTEGDRQRPLQAVGGYLR